MFFFPYSTALTLSRPPVVTYAISLLCVVVFLFQLTSPITESLLYYPESWNPLRMISSSIAHASWLHLIGNLIFFLAFAPALELLIGSKFRYLWIMIVIAIAVGISYSISILIGNSQPLPSLGFSGVVMGLIGLSAYLMPQARIKVFFWYIFMWKTLYVPAWVLAAFYIGLDTWTMLTATDYGGINVVAHVAGGVAGYLYGVFRLPERREETREALDDEIETMKIEQKHGKTRSEAYRYNKIMSERQAIKKAEKEHDYLMRKVYQLVKTHRDSEAVYTLMTYYGLDTPTHELEELYERIQQWGPSRTLLCIGRLIIHKLNMEQRYGRVIVYIEKCQKISHQFILPDLSQTLFYAQLAIENGRTTAGKNLVTDANKKYGNLVNNEQCRYLLQKCKQTNLNKV